MSSRRKSNHVLKQLTRLKLVQKFERNAGRADIDRFPAALGRQTVFFFSSRRRHTSSKRDWSSDVCSSDPSLPPGSSGVTKKPNGSITSNGITIRRQSTVRARPQASPTTPPSARTLRTQQHPPEAEDSNRRAPDRRRHQPRA